MCIMRGEQDGVPYKELIVGYKTIYINTYSLWCTDLGGESKDRATLQKIECFQLWESAISGIALMKNKDWVTFSKSGVNVVALGQVA